MIITVCDFVPWLGGEKERVTELSKQWQRRRKKDGRCVDRGLCRAHD